MEPIETLNLKDFPHFLVIQLQFSHVCLSSCQEVTRISLAFARKQALAQGRPGIRNLPIAAGGQSLNFTRYGFYHQKKPTKTERQLRRKQKRETNREFKEEALET